MGHLKVITPNATTRTDRILPLRGLHWAGLYHMYQNPRLLSVWHYDYTTILSYYSLKSECRTYLTTHAKKKKHIDTYLHLLFIFIFIFKQVIAQKISKTKLGSTLLGDVPVKSPFLSRWFSEIKLLVSIDSIFNSPPNCNFLKGKGNKFEITHIF